MGGSLAKGMRASGYLDLLLGFDVCAATRQNARESHLFNDVLDIQTNFEKEPLDLLVLAVPLERTADVLNQLQSLGCMGERTLVTDLGSVKSGLRESIVPILKGQQHFIGGHPMAGSGLSGFENSSEHLFKGASFFLTVGDVPKHFVRQLEHFVHLIGAKPQKLDSETHDALMADLSHTPHLVACALVSRFVMTHSPEAMRFAGGGFRDTTRIAMGSGQLWQSILIQNKKHVLKSLTGLIQEIETIQGLLEQEDAVQLGLRLTEISKYRINCL